MSTIRNLLKEGAIVLWQDYRSGSAYDWSGQGNSGTLSSGLQWTGPAGSIRFPNTTDEVTVADSSELRLTTGTIVVVSKSGFNRQVTGYLFNKLSGGLGYGFYFSAASLVFAANGGGVSIPTSILGSNSLGVTFVTGGVPVSYKNGKNNGNFSGSVTVSVATAVATIGNQNNNFPCPNDLSSVLICNRVLTDAEMAAVHDELMSMRWPAKYFGHAKRTQISNPLESGIVAGWNLKPVQGEVIDRVGGYNGTIAGSAIYKPGILGDSIVCQSSSDYINAGDPADGGLDVGTEDFVLSTWVRGLPSSGYVFLMSKQGVDPRYYIYLNSNGVVLALADDSVNVAYANTGNFAVRDDCYTHIAASFDRSESNGIIIYVNGVDATATRTGTLDTVGDLNNGNSLHINAQGTGGPNGSIVRPQLHRGITWNRFDTLKDYANGARSLAFSTGWAYPESPQSEGGVLNQQIGGSGSPFRAADTTGRFSVDVDTSDGLVRKTLTATTAGSVYLPASLFFSQTDTEAAFGTFEWSWNKSALTTAMSLGFVAEQPLPMTDASQNGYLLEFTTDARLSLNEITAGVASNIMYTEAGFVSTGSWDRITLCRDPFDGRMDLFQNDYPVTYESGLYPFQDDTYVRSKYVVVSLGVGDQLSLKIHGSSGELAKYFGVVHPHCQVACLGDSITAYSYYPWHLSELLGSCAQNAGVAGDRISAALARVPLIWSSQTVVVLLGVNNIKDGDTAATVKTQLEDLYDTLHGEGYRVIAVQLTPWAGHVIGATKQVETADVNAWIASTAACDAYVDTSSMGDASHVLLPAYDSGDGLHPNSVGQEYLADLIFDQAM